MRYVAARIEREVRDEVYRIYVTDCLKSICGAEKRYYDIAYFSEEEDVDPEEIKASIFGKLKALEGESSDGSV